MTAAETPEAIVARARRGDRAAFGELSQLYESRLRTAVQRRLGEALRQKLTAEDIVQETLLRAMQKIETFEWHGDEALLRWLFGIARRVILELARREKLDLLVPLDRDPEAPGVTPSRDYRRRERFDRLDGALDSLTAEHREVILLARIQRLPIREIARRMDRTPGATAQLLRRALHKLRASLGSTVSHHLGGRSLLDGEQRREA